MHDTGAESLRERCQRAGSGSHNVLITYPQKPHSITSTKGQPSSGGAVEAGYHVCKPGAVHCVEGISEVTTNMQIMFQKDICLVLARWLSWLGRRPVHQKVVGFIPGLGTYLGFRFNPSQGVYGKQQINVFLSHLFLSLSSTKQ